MGHGKKAQIQSGIVADVHAAATDLNAVFIYFIQISS